MVSYWRHGDKENILCCRLVSLVFCKETNTFTDSTNSISIATMHYESMQTFALKKLAKLRSWQIWCKKANSVIFSFWWQTKRKMHGKKMMMWYSISLGFIKRGIIPSHLLWRLHTHLFLLECVINYYQREESHLSCWLWSICARAWHVELTACILDFLGRKIWTFL